ncbi:MAG: hypothetical protein V7L20_28615 [Nostoc sp.]|uniref:hypothetical protein n=1 Tax=Nostoc sp. TaxID=1180 RepID=UPI002FF54E3C
MRGSKEPEGEEFITNAPCPILLYERLRLKRSYAVGFTAPLGYFDCAQLYQRLRPKRSYTAGFRTTPLGFAQFYQRLRLKRSYAAGFTTTPNSS